MLRLVPYGGFYLALSFYGGRKGETRARFDTVWQVSFRIENVFFGFSLNFLFGGVVGGCLFFLEGEREALFLLHKVGRWAWVR